MIEIGPTLAGTIKVLFICLAAIVFFRYVIGSKD